MGGAQLSYFILFASISPSIFAADASKRATALSGKCLVEATVEDCETILLSFSYSNETNTCEKGFVCSNCANRFETELECMTACPQKPGKKGKGRKRGNCRYWLLYGGRCQHSWMEFRKNKRGIRRRLLFYTGCRADWGILYVYDFLRKKCHAVKVRPNGEQDLNEDNELPGETPAKGQRPIPPVQEYQAKLPQQTIQTVNGWENQ
uniref:Pancreatic trypsin inhibitor n=1 Tax=Rhipicephalus appendiculatus TaxID=34631 RepID=A0A131Z4G7_RHIAP